MEIFKTKARGVVYNDHFPAEAPRKALPGFVRAGGLNLSAFRQQDAARLREVNPALFEKLFTVHVIPEKKKKPAPEAESD